MRRLRLAHGRGRGRPRRRRLAGALRHRLRRPERRVPPRATLGFPNTHRGRARPALPQRRARRRRPPDVPRGRRRGRARGRRGSSTGSASCSPTSTATATSTPTSPTTPTRTGCTRTSPWPGGAEADPAGLGFRFEERAAAAGVADPGSGMGVAGRGLRRATGAPTSSSRTRGGRCTASSAATRRTRRSPRSRTCARLSGRPSAARPAGACPWADLDLDTDLDLVLANGAVPVTDLRADAEQLQVFVRERSGRFDDASPRAGLARSARCSPGAARRPTTTTTATSTWRCWRSAARSSCSRTRGTRGNWLEVAARGVPARRRGDSGAPGRPAAPPRGTGGQQLPVLRGSALPLRARRRAPGARGGRALAGRRGDAPARTWRRTRCSSWRRPSEAGDAARARGDRPARSPAARSAAAAAATRPSPSTAASGATSAATRSHGSGTRRCWTRSGATSPRRRCTRATSSTSRPRCGTPGRRTTPEPTATSSRRSTRPATSARRARRRSATPRTGSSCTATRSPPGSRRRSPA